MSHSKLQLEVLQLYKQFLRFAEKQQENDLRKHVREIFRKNSTQIEKSNTILIEYHLRRGKWQLDQLKKTSVTGFQTITIISN